MTATARSLISREPHEADLPTAVLEIGAPFPTTAGLARCVTLRLNGEDGEVCWTDDDLDLLRDAVADAIRVRDAGGEAPALDRRAA